MAVETILQSPFVIEVLLPFLLIFVVMFAILQKTEILGKEKRQIDAIVALVVGLIVVAFGYAVGFIINIIPILAITAVVILVFMMLYGMVHPQGGFTPNKWLKGGIGVIVGIVVVISVLVLTGAWEIVIDYYNQTGSEVVVANIVFFVVAIIVVAVVVLGKGSDGDSSETSSKTS
tara:strand:- start:1297 stop:1821 length:525 start_codon:yes stop_codon:yes gene_type:complete